MKKIFKFGSLLLGLSLVGGGIATVGINKGTKEVRAGEYDAAVCDFRTQSTGHTAYSDEWSYGDYTVFGGANNGGDWAYVKFGAKKQKAADPDKVSNCYVVTPKMTSAIEKITVSIKASSVNAVCTWSIESSLNNDFSDSKIIDGGTINQKSDGTYTFSNTWAENSYYKIHFDVTNKSTTNGALWVNYISFVAISSGQTALDSISCEDIELLPGHSETLEVSYDPSSADNKDVTFAIKSGNDVIDVSDKGLVTALKAGTAIVTITPDDENADPIDVNVTVGEYPSVEVVEVGKKYLISGKNGETDYYLTTFASSLYGADLNVANANKIEVVAGLYENTVAFKDGEKYIAYTGNSNSIAQTSTVDATSSWTVATENDALVMRNVAQRDRVFSFNYNGGTNLRFAAYGNLNQQRVAFTEYVEGVDLVSFTITETLDVKVGLTGTIAVTYNPANASDKTLTWVSENEEIATVVDGVVTGVAEGITTITASKSGLTSQTCLVTVSKIAQHEGSESDPYTVADAVAVAKGGTEGMKTGKYIKGLVTKFISGASATSCSFWVGDNLEQISAETGAFEAFKLANITADAFKLIKIGSTVIISGDITLYQSKTAETSEGGTLVYNSYAVANEFAKAWNENMATICAETKSDPAGTAANFDLFCEFSVNASSYNLLAADVKVHFLGEGKTGSNATEVEKMIATYDFCMSKYTNLVNFLGRTPAASARQFIIADYNNNNTSVTIITIVSVASVGCLIALIAIKRRKSMITK